MCGRCTRSRRRARRSAGPSTGTRCRWWRGSPWLHDRMGVSVAALDELRSALPGDLVVTDADAVEKYRYDWSRDPSAGTPVGVVRAECADHVQVAVRWAAEHRVPVVPRGAGSGLSGGSSALDDGIVVILEQMTAVEIVPLSQVAVVEPGAFNRDVKAAAAEEGLW